VKYRLKTYGITREIMGGQQVEVDAQVVSVGELRAHLIERYPELAALRSLFIAVNLEYADDSATILETDEIALIPPVSGG
jgi:molybdopterin synthase sulfur carrier subunit